MSCLESVWMLHCMTGSNNGLETNMAGMARRSSLLPKLMLWTFWAGPVRSPGTARRQVTGRVPTMCPISRKGPAQCWARRWWCRCCAAPEESWLLAGLRAAAARLPVHATVDDRCMLLQPNFFFWFTRIEFHGLSPTISAVIISMPVFQDVIARYYFVKSAFYNHISIFWLCWFLKVSGPKMNSKFRISFQYSHALPCRSFKMWSPGIISLNLLSFVVC